MDAHQSSKLAVILHADIVGSTDLVQRNESTAHFKFTSLFRSFSKTIDAYGGFTRELRGDALVAEFGRASDAVSAALTFQQKNARSNAESNDTIQPVMRIGISLGEVVIADGTITGAGVVMAQRLEQLAEPGAVCIQGAVHDTVPRRLPISYRSLGEQQLKGFSEPVRAVVAELESSDTALMPDPARSLAPNSTATSKFRRLLAGIGIAVLMACAALGWHLRQSDNQLKPVQSGLANPIVQTPSIAVLPFENLSGDTSQEYVSDGLTQNIITALSQVPETTVIARNSTFSYKGSAINLKQVANELGVRYVVEGSFHREGDQIRIHAQLVDALNSRQLWAERFDRTFAGIFALHDDITLNVVSALEIKLSKDVQDRIALHYTENVAAYDLFLRGNAQFFRFNKQSNARARELFEQALALDPQFARAHGALSITHTFDYRFSWTTDETALEKGLLASQRAVAANDQLPQAYLSLGQARAFRGELNHALEAVNKAIALDHNYADAYALRAMIQTFAGATQDSIASIDQAKRLNPRSNAVYNMIRGRALYFADRFDEAFIELQEAVGRNPNYLLSHVYLALTQLSLGNGEDASWQAEEIIALQPDFSITGWTDAEILSNTSYVQRVHNGLREIGLPE